MALAAQGDEAARREALQWLVACRGNTLALRAEARMDAKSRALPGTIGDAELARREAALRANDPPTSPVDAPDDPANGGEGRQRGGRRS